MHLIKERLHNSLFKKISRPDISTLKKLSRPVIFEIRGTNGSGKSTVPFKLQSLDPDAFILKGKSELGQIKITVLPSFRTLVAGDYPTGKAVGGCDRISGSELIEATIVAAAGYQEAFPSLFDRILFEGIMTSTSNTRYIRTLKTQLEDRFDYVVAWCNTPLEICIKRVANRSSGVFNEKLVEGKFSQTQNQIKPFKEAFPDVVAVEYDCMCSVDQMVQNWLEFDYKEIG
jgi:hypothetical protein